MASLRSRTGYFVGLSGLAFVTMCGLGEHPACIASATTYRDRSLGLKLSVVQEPHKYLHQCSLSTLHFFRSFPSILQKWLCTLYTAIQASPSASPGAYTLFSQLVRMGAIFMPIVALESHWQKRWWARRGIDIFLLMAQALSGAVSIPLYFATVTSGFDSTEAEEPASLKAEQTWTVFASTAIGYLLPLLYGVQTGWSNRAITVFLGFPIYFIALNRTLPAVFSRFPAIQSLPKSLPMTLTAATAAVLSADGHFKLLLSGIKFNSIFWPFTNPASTTRDLHILLTHDYLFCLIELASFVILYCHRKRTTTEKRHIMLNMLGQAAIFGPSAAIAWTWAGSVSDDIQRAEAATEGERTPLLDEASNRRQS